jgi:hypothetical protein
MLRFAQQLSVGWVGLLPQRQTLRHCVVTTACVHIVTTWHVEDDTSSKWQVVAGGSGFDGGFVPHLKMILWNG